MAHRIVFGLSEFPCTHPACLNTAGVFRDELPLWRKANSYECPRGIKTGVGYILLARKYFNALDTNTHHPLRFYNDFEDVIVPKLYIKRARSMFGEAGDSRSPMLLELVDRRHIMMKSSFSRQYNVLMPNPPRPGTTANRYYSDSLNAGALFTWQTMITDMWSYVTEGGTAPTLPYTPSSTPQSIRFPAGNPWSAMEVVLGRIGCEVAYDAVADDFNIERLGATDQSLTATTLKRMQKRLMLDFDPVQGAVSANNSDELCAAANLPQTVRVFFPKAYQWRGIEADTPRSGNWEMAAYESKDAATNVGGAKGTQPIAGDMWALIGRGGTVENASALQSRANEIRDDIALSTPYPRRQAYSGATNVFWVGSKLSKLIYRDYGDKVGQVTIIENEHRQAIDKTWRTLEDECVLPFDIARKTHPLFPHLMQIVEVYDPDHDPYTIIAAQSATLPDGGSSLKVHPAKVRLYRNGLETLDDCWITILDNFDEDVGDAWLVNRTELVGRMCGSAIGSTSSAGSSSTAPKELPLYGVVLGDRHGFGRTNEALPAGGSALVTVYEKTDQLTWVPTTLVERVYNPWQISIGANKFCYFIWDKTARQWIMIQADC